MQTEKRILLLGGGSGGHVVPNLAIATALKQKNSHLKFLYIGSRNKLDRELVKPSGIPYKGIFAGKLRRYFSWRNFVDPFLILIGFFQSLFILVRFWPHVVFSKGGYVSLPMGFAAFVLRRPIILHESDAVMGLANRVVSKLAKKVCIAFPEAGSGLNTAVLTGNPIRPAISGGSAEKGFEMTGFRPEKPVLLVWGGSLGAQQINDMIQSNFEEITDDFQIIHITGKGKQTELQSSEYRQYEYLGEALKDIYAITTIAVGRAGANSLAELAYLQIPNILIPLSNADQMKNAAYFEQEGASVVLRDEPLTDMLSALANNPAKMQSMKEALARISRPKAAADIADIILKI